MYFSDYYLSLVKGLLVAHNLWDLWAWDTECEWDCSYDDAFSFMSEMCYCYGLGSPRSPSSDPCAYCSSYEPCANCPNYPLGN